ncbi:MAG TPA: acetyl-CoA carboxylase biotin carboxyl carrier protein [Pyrinomonadaceae bacterium]|nr:acetyl-CoA carboxylase biotin carboxyl carrier protein [Pyrinomonadaceae bacterium]
MSEEKRPEAQGSDHQTTNDSSGGTRQQPADTRRSSNSVAAGGGNVGGGSGGGGGRHGGSRRRHRGGERENQAPSSGRRTESSINMDELRELADLITAQGFTEFELEKEGFRLRLSRNVYSQPAQPGSATDSGGFTHFSQQPPATGSHAASAPSAAETSANASTGAAAATAPSVAENVNILTSPIVGTFYRSPAPDAGPYVEVGSRVTRGQVVCIIEAMKLMNEIEAEWDGVITEIFPQNAQAVEFGERLFGIKAS